MRGTRQFRARHARFGLAMGMAALTLTASAQAAPVVLVNDSWADGGFTDGTDPLDVNWWTSSATAGIEVSTGSLGMVTGATAGRGIHTVFPTQTLANIGDKLVATFTFTTPDTIGAGGSGVFRIGLFDTLGRAGLNANVTASSGSPNAVYGWGTGAGGPGAAGLPGYMMDLDVGATQDEDLNFREHDAGTVNPTGRLLATNTGFTSISPSGPNDVYSWAANTVYTGSITLTRSSATEMQVSGTLGAASHSVTDTFDSVDVGMLAFWANSNVFGNSSTQNTPDNGIDFSNVTIVFEPVPEPGAAAVLALAASGAALWRRRRT